MADAAPSPNPSPAGYAATGALDLIGLLGSLIGIGLGVAVGLIANQVLTTGPLSGVTGLVLFAVNPLALLLILLLIDMIEMIRRFSDDNIGLAGALGLAALNVASSFYSILPLMTVLAGITLFLGLARSSEMVAIRASGRSALRVVRAPVATAIGQLTSALGDVPLIGFAGAPFTLASYLVEGGPSRNHEKTKAMMHAEPETWHLLMRRLVPTITRFLQVQVDAGIDAMQLFDSWAGYLNERDYREFVLPYSREILAGVNIPRIHFGVGTGELLPAMSEAGSEVMGVDYRVPMDAAAERVGARVLQGNLDPAMLFAGDAAVRQAVRTIRGEVERAQQRGDIDTHIWNLGHGVLPTTDAEAITRAVSIIHEEG
mgnify:CR=1 FL=1